MTSTSLCSRVNLKNDTLTYTHRYIAKHTGTGHQKVAGIGALA
jgi:hypothetical protein